ncbi:hypothetical protein WDW37_00020 [Bdellovibrionota bacterium FG-1]
MKKTIRRAGLAVVLGSIALTGALTAHSAFSRGLSPVALIGLGDSGQNGFRSISPGSYRDQMEVAVQSVHESVFPELACTRNPDGPLRLNTVVVGFAINTQVGLGPIFSISGKPRIRLLYSRARIPTFPFQ